MAAIKWFDNNRECPSRTHILLFYTFFVGNLNIGRDRIVRVFPSCDLIFNRQSVGSMIVIIAELHGSETNS